MSLGCYRYARQFKRVCLDFDLERAEERAGIQQFDGGLDRDDAEFEAALVQWVEQGRSPLEMPYLGK